MIFDKKENIEHYLGISKNLDTAIEFIKRENLNSLPWGRTTIDGDDVFVNHFSYTTADKTSESMFEDHSEYLDLHFPLHGSEMIAISEVPALTFVENRSSEDSVMYVGDIQMMVPVTSKSFLVVYPGEVHLPKLTTGEKSDVDKLVFKIRL